MLESLSRLGQIEQTESYAQFLQQLATFQGIESVAPPDSLKNCYQFYAYQQHGYNWLAFLRRFGLNGILADDMGLGKTLQTLAVILHSREIKARGSHHPSLIICPVSVMANWEAEIKRFFPGTSVVQYRGPNRRGMLNGMYFAAIVLTSYTVAANDFDELADIPWNYVVIDEAHAIKNPGIQRTKKVKQIGGLHKLALTGTPVQNAASQTARPQAANLLAVASNSDGSFNSCSNPADLGSVIKLYLNGLGVAGGHPATGAIATNPATPFPVSVTADGAGFVAIESNPGEIIGVTSVKIRISSADIQTAEAAAVIVSLTVDGVRVREPLVIWVKPQH